MKKFIWIISIILLITLVFSCALVGCKEKEENHEEENERKVVVVFEPLDDASVNDLRNIVGLFYATFMKNGITSCSVKLVDNNKRIQLTIPDESYALKVLRWIQSPITLEIRKEGRDEELKSNPYITNNDLQSASVSTDSHGSFVVALKFNEEGTKKFEAATAERMGKSINFWLDGEWVMGPTVGFVISNGEATITGNYSYEEANELATRIQMGSMKVRLQIYDMKTYPEDE